MKKRNVIIKVESPYENVAGKHMSLEGQITGTDTWRNAILMVRNPVTAFHLL